MKPNATVALKSLQVQLTKANEELKVAQQEKTEASDKLQKAQSRVKKIKKEIDDLTSQNELVVTEHALVRYFERVLGFDLEEIKQKIISDQIREQVEIVGNSGTFPNDGFKVKLERGVAITILD